MESFPAALSQEEYRFILIVSILSALAGFYYFMREWKRWHLIKDTPTARLRSAHQGYVELKGRGKSSSPEPCFAPLSNHECLWHDSQIERKETILHQQRTRTEWKTLYQNTSDRSFLFDDGTGTCLIHPEGAEIISNEKLIWHGNTEWPGRTRILDNGSAAVALTSRYRYTERLILPGQPLYILGQLQTQSPATERSVQDIMRDLVSDWKRDTQQLLERFDSDRNGEIDQIEWEAARQAAQSQAQILHRQLLHEPEIHHISKPNDSSRPYIISVRPQTELIRKYRRNALIALAVSLGMTSCAIWLLHTYG